MAPLDALKEAQEQVAKTQNQVIKAQKQVSKAQEEIIKAQQQVSKAQQQVFNAQQQVSMAKQQVCTALKNISSDKHGKDVSRAGGVEAVLQALKQYKADPQVQQDGCSALWKLCRDGEACRRAGEAGAVQATVEVLKTYTDKVVRETCFSRPLMSVIDSFLPAGRCPQVVTAFCPVLVTLRHS